MVTEQQEAWTNKGKTPVPDLCISKSVRTFVSASLQPLNAASRSSSFCCKFLSVFCAVVLMFPQMIFIEFNELDEVQN